MGITSIVNPIGSAGGPHFGFRHFGFHRSGRPPA